MNNALIQIVKLLEEIHQLTAKPAIYHRLASITALIHALDRETLISPVFSRNNSPLGLATMATKDATCPRCSGTGHIHTPGTTGIEIPCFVCCGTGLEGGCAIQNQKDIKQDGEVTLEDRIAALEKILNRPRPE